MGQPQQPARSGTGVMSVLGWAAERTFEHKKPHLLARVVAINTGSAVRIRGMQWYACRFCIALEHLLEAGRSQLPTDRQRVERHVRDVHGYPARSAQEILGPDHAVTAQSIEKSGSVAVVLALEDIPRRPDIGTPPVRFDWARQHAHGYECSTAGDRRFSPLFARLSDGRLIVDAHEVHLRVDRLRGSDWRLGKGKRALNPRADLWQSYLSLWAQWAQENPALMLDLARRARYGMLTDQFARTGISQARALAHLLNEAHGLSVSGPTPDANTPPAPRVSAATTPGVLGLARARDKR